MGILEGDFMVIGGGGGGVGHAKIMATCIYCSSKVIFAGFISGKVSFFPLWPRLLRIFLLFPWVSCMGGSNQTQGWPWWIWRTTCCPRSRAWHEQNFFGPSPSCWCRRECLLPSQSNDACQAWCWQLQWHDDLHCVCGDAPLVQRPSP